METTHQEGLNRVVIEKVKKMIAKNQKGVEATMSRLITESNMARDFTGSIGVQLRQLNRVPEVTFSHDEKVLMNLPVGSFDIHPHAVSQLGYRLGIPAPYLRELSTGQPWERKLCTTILNEHSLGTERSRVLIRTVAGQVRGVLSDRYRRLNSEKILSAFIKEAQNLGAVMADAYMSDTKVWVETLLPNPFIVSTVEGDVVIYMGVRLSTSDYGDGALDIRSYLLNGACLNGMVRTTEMKKVHLGSKLEENIMLSDRTYALDTMTTVSAVVDLTRGLYGEQNLFLLRQEIEMANRQKVDFETELKRLMKAGLMKGEVEGVREVLIRHDPTDGLLGGQTLWNLTQAMTAFARDMVDPERRRTLHEIAGAQLNRLRLSA